MTPRRAITPTLPDAIECPECGNHTLQFQFRGEQTMSTYWAQWYCEATFLVDGRYEPCSYRKPWEIAIYDHAAIVPVEVAA